MTIPWRLGRGILCASHSSWPLTLTLSLYIPRNVKDDYSLEVRQGYPLSITL